MRSRWSITALGAFFVVIALVIAGCGSSGSSLSSKTVATVAGNPISTQAFNHWLYVDAKGNASQSPGQPVIVPNDPPNFTKCINQARAAIPQLKKTSVKTVKADCSMLFTSLSGQVMGFLIQAYWYQAEAHKQGLTLTNAQIQKALAAAKKGQFKTSAQYAAFLKQSGQTANDILYRVRVNQVFEKLIKQHPTTVSSADVSAYYSAHKSQFGSPQRRNLRIVLAKTQSQASAARQALQHGQSWNAVARKYSTDPTTKNKGGVLDGVTAGTQDAALSKAAFAASPNKLEGPVKGQFGYYVLEVTKVTAATQKSLAQSTSLIKKTLTGQKQQAAQTAVDAQVKKDYLSRTMCAKPYAMADCKGYKAPKTSTPPGAAGGATAPSGAATAPSGAATAPSGAATAPTPTTATSTSSK